MGQAKTSRKAPKIVKFDDVSIRVDKDNRILIKKGEVEIKILTEDIKDGVVILAESGAMAVISGWIKPAVLIK